MLRWIDDTLEDIDLRLTDHEAYRHAEGRDFYRGPNNILDGSFLRRRIDAGLVHHREQSDREKLKWQDILLTGELKSNPQ